MIERNHQRCTSPNLARIQAMLDDPAFAENPLLPTLHALLDHVAKLEKRLDKISTISDRYQAQLKEANAQLDTSARTDLLTGLSNRRDMINSLLVEINRVQRNQSGFALLVADIDHFKTINDTYGHLVGDQVIIHIARQFESTLRLSDRCARWGGEEFLVLLPDTDAAGAAAIAERLRTAAAEALHFIDTPIAVTVSIGGACFRPGYSIDEMLHLADTMLYAAKDAGRNRIIIAPEA